MIWVFDAANGDILIIIMAMHAQVRLERARVGGGGVAACAVRRGLAVHSLACFGPSITSWVFA